METPVRSVYNEKLSLKNRSVWILRSKAAITAAKAGGALSKPRDDTNADKHESAKSVIVNLLEDGDLDLWEKHDDINELYKALEKRYKDLIIARKPVLWKQLSSVKMKPGESLRSYMKRIKDLVAELKECGDTVSDSNAITHALTGLTSSYKQFTNSFFAIAMSKDLEELEGKLLLVEQQVEAEATEATTVSLHAGQERFNNRNSKAKRDDGGNNNINNNDSGFRGRCYNCGQRGHRSADCKKQKEDKPFCTHCKKTGHTLAQCWSAPRKREEKKLDRDEDDDFPKDGPIFMFLPSELVESPVDPQVMVAKTEDYDSESQVEAAIWSWEPSGDLPCGDDDDMLEMRVVVPREVTVAVAIEPPMVLQEVTAAAAIEPSMVPREVTVAAAIESPMVEPLEQSAAAAIESPMVEPLEQSAASIIERWKGYMTERLAELLEESSMEPEAPFLDDLPSTSDPINDVETAWKYDAHTKELSLDQDKAVKETPTGGEHKVTSSSEVVLSMGAINQMMIDYVDWLENECGIGATTPAAMVVPQSKGETLLCDKSASGLNSKRMWFVDLGSFYHVTPDKDSLQNYRVLEEPLALTPVTGKPLYAIGYGDVVLCIDSSRSLHAFRQDRTGEPVLITVKGLFYVPGFHFRLISLKQLSARGAEYSGYGSSMSVFHQRSTTPNHHQKAARLCLVCQIVFMPIASACL